MWKVSDDDNVEEEGAGDGSKGVDQGEEEKTKKKGGPVVALGPHKGKVTCLAFSQDGYRLATGDEARVRVSPERCLLKRVV